MSDSKVLEGKVNVKVEKNNSEQEGSSPTIVMSKPMFGHLEPFVVGEKFDEYVSRLEQFFLVNDVPAAKKVPTLVTMAGPSLYSIAARICSPDDPCTKPYNELIQLLTTHLAPTVNVVAERYKFRKCEQSSGQSISDFIITLKAQSHSCSFAAFLQEALRDQFVAGVQNSNLRTKLLTEVDLTFEKACNIARSWEAVEHESKVMQGTSKLAMLHRKPQKKPQKPFRIQEKPKQQSKPTMKNEVKNTCFRCGRSHNPESCPAKQWTCYACGKAGHVSTMCRSTKEQKATSQNRVAEMSEAAENWKLNLMSEIVESVREPETSLATPEILRDSSRNGVHQLDVPAHLQLEIEGTVVKFEVDTGACDTVISRDTYSEKLSHVKLQQSCKCFQTVTGQNIRPEGEIKVQVKARNGEMVSLPIFVIQPEEGRTITHLLGRSGLDVLIPEWRKMVSLDFSSISTIQPSLQSELQKKFPFVFSGDLNQTIEGFTVDIALKPNAMPIFHKPYTIPFRFRENVDQELDRMIKSEILVPVRSSSWASPIVVTPKKDGSVRICLDGKATLNRYLSSEHYPLPLIDDILASLADFKVFCKIDLTGAYLQVKLSELSQEFCTVNTHRGLFRYTRMPFGISSAPSLFQSIIDQILVGTGAVPYLDDIVVGGRTPQECKKRLFDVLERLNRYKVQINMEKSRFFEDEIEHLGFLLTTDGISPSPSKVEAVLNAPAPRDETNSMGRTNTQEVTRSCTEIILMILFDGFLRPECQASEEPAPGPSKEGQQLQQPVTKKKSQKKKKSEKSEIKAIPFHRNFVDQNALKIKLRDDREIYGCFYLLPSESFYETRAYLPSIPYTISEPTVSSLTVKYMANDYKNVFSSKHPASTMVFRFRMAKMYLVFIPEGD
ncbi:uncharacterized protein K02A2.6-like [Topomyia yanbarensis]|uniref:uncharacterized protein K02A2.6-like n=1 Tax=Topomyia yanbarensis TaxID=2498891 RepID=UPI00273B2050|nr:uncharacterized protein K02A2.6-like [Topomyia yanbarensis]